MKNGARKMASSKQTPHQHRAAAKLRQWRYQHGWRLALSALIMACNGEYQQT